MLLNEDMLNEQVNEMIGCNLEFLLKFLPHTANSSTLLLTLTTVEPSIQEPLRRGRAGGVSEKEDISCARLVPTFLEK